MNKKEFDVYEEYENEPGNGLFIICFIIFCIILYFYR